MASFSRKVCVFSAFLALFCTLGVVRGDDSKDPNDGVTVETEEDDHYHSPQVNSQNVFLAEHFDDVTAFNKKWIKSEAKKQGVDENIAKYDGRWEILSPSRKILKNDLGLVLTTEAKHAAISALLDRPFDFKGKQLVVQYEVTMQEGQNCGGAYIKLLSRGTNTKADLRKFYDQTPYTIMFGPDKCGNDNKLHFIFRHQNPRNGSIEEKHSKKPSQRLEDIYKDKEPHLYTLIVNYDNSFKILVDSREVNSGTLLEDFTPPVNPPEEIDDPNDKKPDDWDEREKIVDPSATKPEDWDESAPAQIVDPNAVKPSGWLDDEPVMIPDPDAQKPSDWDEEMDGEWEAPLIDNPTCAAAAGCGPWTPPSIANPNYKGPWRAPLVSNPNYRGKWTPSRIPNPEYFKDEHPYEMTPIHAVGFELWSMSPMLLFDNLIITDEIDVADEWARNTFWMKRSKLTSDSKTVWGRILRATNYKPGWWAAYAVYVAIPVAIYVGYLLRQAKEDSVFESAMKYAADNPWVYGVVILGAFAVVALVAYLCIGSTPSDSEDPKKTDAVVEDDAHLSDGEQSDHEHDHDHERDHERDHEPDHEPDRPTKADLEGPPLDEQLPTTTTTTTTTATDDTEETPLVDTEGAGDGQRKRKPRKE